MAFSTCWQLIQNAYATSKPAGNRSPLLQWRLLQDWYSVLQFRDHLAEYQNAFVERARDAGRQFDLKVYKGGGHSFMTQPAFEKPSTRDVEQFLRQHRFLPAVNR